MPQFYRATRRFPPISLTPESDIPTMGGMPLSRLWLAVLVAPTNVPTMRSLWLKAGPVPGTTVPAFGAGGTLLARLAGLVALLALFLLLFTLGVEAWG